MNKSNGNAASYEIPPMITRIITRDVMLSGESRLVWTAGGALPVNPAAKIVKILLAEDGIEVYSLGMIETPGQPSRIVGFRTTLRAEDVLCIDEVMDSETLAEEIRLAEEEDDEPDDEDEDDEEEDEPAAARPAETLPAPPLVVPAPPAAPSLPAPTGTPTSS